MIVFFSEEKSSLIVTPYRCGSRHLIKNAEEYNLIHFNVDTEYGKKLFNTIKDEIKLKTFIYRDPIDRYLSFYHTFVFNKTPKDAGKYVVPKFRSKNFWEDAYNSLDLLGNNIDKDNHTKCQTSFFSDIGESVDDYEFIDVENYTKFIYLNFADKLEKHTRALDNVSLNYYSLMYLDKIKYQLKKIYKQDFNLKNHKNYRYTI